MTVDEYIALPDEYFIRLSHEWITRMFDRERADKYHYVIHRNFKYGELIRIVCTHKRSVVSVFPTYYGITVRASKSTNGQKVHKHSFIHWTQALAKYSSHLTPLP